MKRINIFLLSALFFALTFFSCNKHDDDKTEPEKTTVENNSGNDNREVTPEKVTVTFDILGGNGTAEPQTVEKGTKITLPSGDGMEKAGFKFLGWSLTENGEIITEYTATEGEVKLYAVWEQVIFTVKFDTDGGTGEFTAQTIEKGKTATKPEIKPEKDDYVFMGWYDGDTKFDFSTAIIDDVTLKAKYAVLLKGVFSVSDERKVRFSSGNLQYNTSTSKFQFAEHQYEIIGNGGANSGVTGIRDLFGWGTWLEGGNPMNNSTTNDDYTWDDTKKSAIGEEWVTLTKDEWDYLISRNEEKKIGVAEVNGVQGLVILPDDWIKPDGVEFKSGFANKTGSEYYKDVNEYGVEQWNQMESAGAVFLPAAGLRHGSGVFTVGDDGYYWSAPAYVIEYAYGFDFESTHADCFDDSRCHGHSVRLMRVLQN